MMRTPATNWSQYPESIPVELAYAQVIPDSSALLMSAAVLLIAVLSLLGSGKKKPRSNPPDAPQVEPKDAASAAPDLRRPVAQMAAISQTSFERTPILTRPEARLLPVLEATLRRIDKGHRVMAQTSLSELLRPGNLHLGTKQGDAAFASIRSKRLDFAIIDLNGLLVCALEIQHEQDVQASHFLRDAVKRAVLRRAKVPLIEVPAQFADRNVENALLRVLGEPVGSEHRHATVHV